MTDKTFEQTVIEALEDPKKPEPPSDHDVLVTLSKIVLETPGHGYDGPTHSLRVRILEAFVKEG